MGIDAELDCGLKEGQELCSRPDEAELWLLDD